MRKSQVFVYPLENRVAFPYHQFQTSIIANDFEAKNCDYLIGFVTKTDTTSAKLRKFREFSEVGTLMRIHKSSNSMIKGQLKSNNYSLMGVTFARFKVLSLQPRESGYLAEIEILDDNISKGVETELMKSSLYEQLKNELMTYYEASLNKIQADESVQKLEKETSLNKLIYTSVSVLDLSIDQSLQFLQLNDVTEKILKLTKLVSRKAQIVNKFNKRSNQKTPDYSNSANVSRFNLKSYKRIPEIEKIQKQLQGKELPDYVRDDIQKQLDTCPLTSKEERTVSANYINTLLSIPWNQTTEDNIDLEKAEEILSKEHVGLERVKERIIEFLAVRFRGGNTKGNVLCLCGPPGVGKTSIAKSIANAMGRKFAKVSLAGVIDEAELRGHRRTYTAALPGAIIRALINAKSSNPVILLDEIDKLGQSQKGSPANALLEILDPSQNSSFIDHYVALPYDLSKVLFVCTANNTQIMSHPLLNRLEVISLPGYTKEEKFQIALKHIIPLKLRDNAVAEILRFQDEAIRQIVEHSDQMGVRNLERNVDKICRRVARKGIHTLVTKQKVNEILGTLKEDRIWSGIGVVKNLVCTELGGRVMIVQACKFSGEGKIHVAKQLGNAMKQSVSLALSWIKSNLYSIEYLNQTQFEQLLQELEKTNIHIHFLEGSAQNDNSSAGLAIVSCLVSALLGIEPMKTIAMTGETTLSGQVLPVGGILQKVTAAINQGIQDIILPYENQWDAEEIPAQYKKKARLHFVRTIDQALRLSFPKREQMYRSKL